MRVRIGLTGILLGLLSAGAIQAAMQQPVVPPAEAIPAPPPQSERVLTLDEATALSLANNPLLLRAAGALEQARGRAIQAGLYPNPRLDGGNPQQLGGSQSLYNTGLTQPVVTAGKLRLDVAAANRAVQQAELDFQRERYGLLTAVRRQFFVVLAGQERVQTIRNLFAIAQQSLNISEKLLKAEQGAETDVLLLRIELRRIEASQANLQTGLAGGLRALAATIGLADLQIDRVAGDLGVQLPDFDDEASRARLLAINAEIIAARIEVARNQILTRRAIAQRVPNVEWQGGYQYTVTPTHNQAVVAAYFDVPLWNRNQGNIAASAAGTREAAARSEVVANEALRQLAESLGRYRAARQLVGNLEQGVLPDARRTVRLVQRGFEEGEFDLVRLLRAQRALFEATLDYITAQTDRLTSGAEIAGQLQLDRFP